jgi:hypothetical protein
MRAVSLALFVCLWGISQGPAVLAGTRATIEDSARINRDLCRGEDGNWYPAGAQQCQPTAADRQPAAATEAADLQNTTEAARASETPASPPHVSFLAAFFAVVVSLVAIAITAVLRTSQRASKAASKPEVQPPNTAAQSQSGQWMIQPRPSPMAGESLPPPPSTSPTLPVLAEQARLIDAWTGPACTVEFTYQNGDGERHRRKVGVTRISRDPTTNGWYLHGFCHLEQRERSFEADGILTKLLYKSRRWDLEDWIKTVAGEQDRDS